MTTITAESVAPTTGSIHAVAVTSPSTEVRAALRAASIAPHGLSRIRTLIACDVIQTTANTATDSGTIRMLSSQLVSIVATGSMARPGRAAPTVMAVSGEPEPMMNFEPRVTSDGITAPAATSPLTLFSKVSAISSGFFQPGGMVAPSASFAATRPTSSRPHNQKPGLPYQG